jgi:hypothetical protein
MEERDLSYRGADSCHYNENKDSLYKGAEAAIIDRKKRFTL